MYGRRQARKKNNFNTNNKEKNVIELNNTEKTLLKNKFNSFSPDSNKFLASEIFKSILVN